VKFRFGEYHLDTEQKQVVGPDGSISLRPQTFAVLCHLVKQAPSVVSRDELLDAVWGHQATSVSSVAQTIKELRQAFKDSSSDPRFIATRRGMGYQFIAPVEGVPDVSVSDADSTSTDTSVAAIERSRLGLRPWPVALISLAALAILAVWWAQPPPLNKPSDRVPTLAVSALANADDDPGLAWLEPALKRYLGHALIELAGFRVVPADAPAFATELDGAAIDYLVDGRYAAGPDGVRLVAELRRPGETDTIFSMETRHPEWNVAELSIELATAIRDTLGFSAPPDADSAAIRLRLPRAADAQKAYFSAEGALGELDPDRALEGIRAARQSEPDHPRLDHLEALALSQRGDLRAARDAAARAMEKSALWPRRDRLDLEATAASLDFDFDRAAERLQSLNQFFPEPASMRRMIDAQIQAGRLDAAAQSLVAQRDRLGSSTQRHLLAARLAQAREDHPARLESSRLAVRSAKDGRELHLKHHGRLSEAQALARLGDSSAAAETLTALIERPRELNETEYARALLALARVRLMQGELDQALATAKQSQIQFDSIPAPAGAAEASLLLAGIHDRAERTEAAISALVEAVDQFAAIGDRRNTAEALRLFGSVLARAGRDQQALDRFEQAAASFRGLGDRTGQARALFDQASILRRLGQPIDAEQRLQRALEAFSDADDLHGRARSLGDLAAISAERGNFSGSIRQAEEAIEMLTHLDARADLARVSLDLGLVHRQRGDLGKAEHRIRQSVEAFDAVDSDPLHVQALFVLGQLLISMGRFDELGPVLETLETVAENTPAERSRAHSLLGERALVTGRIREARREFQSAYDLEMEAGREDRLVKPRLDLARTTVALGQSVEAEPAIRDLVVAFERAGRDHDQVDALMLLAEALIDQGRGDEATAVLAQADQRLSESPDAEQTLELALLRCRVTDGPQAQERLDWVMQTADQQGFARLRQRAADLSNPVRK